MHILFLSRWFPFPPDNGSKLRIYHLLQGLSQRHRVTLITFYDPEGGLPNTEAIRPYCQSIFTFPWRDFHTGSSASLRGFFSLTPRFFRDTFSPQLKECIVDVLARDHVDLVIASQIDMAAYAPSFSQHSAIFEEVELGVMYEQYALASSWQQRLRRGFTWWKHRQYLGSILKFYRAGTVVSDREAELISQQIDTCLQIEVIPNNVDLRSYSDIDEAPEPYSMIFTGAFTFEPNYKAMLWFIERVYPLIHKQAPQAKLTITGDHAGRHLPQSERITLSGYVKDVRPLIARSWCSIVPIQQGGGTRLKILEAMALKTPVVATSKGAEGLDVHPQEHLLIADDPVSFANAVLTLFNDRDLHHRLATNAYNLVREKYDWSVVMPRFIRLVENVIKVR
jgi:glycosyltransferase involved in cell wall biosynthesis